MVNALPFLPPGQQNHTGMLIFGGATNAFGPTNGSLICLLPSSLL
jgi:hypothetical protein